MDTLDEELLFLAF
uniref:Uncharacterized protein n=1 Tax=Rhizophora mucronata TaxID=61149 RepID=A0A2P2PMR3_RHIMU